ncbi:TapB family protein [Spirosoma koreense]
MKSLVFSLVLTTLIGIKSMAQDCLGMTFKAGMGFEMSLFNAKDKPTGKITYQVKEVHKEGSSTVMDISAQFQDEKGNPRPPYAVHYTCTGDELIADMSGLFQSMQSNGPKDMEMKMKSNKLAYPGKFTVGQKLSDGQMEAEMSMSGNTMTTMTMNMINRQVEGKESITTPAGTFNAYKITSDMNSETRVMGIPVRNSMHTISYRADNQILDVKSETYNKNGKLMGYTLLTKIN